MPKQNAVEAETDTFADILTQFTEVGIKLVTHENCPSPVGKHFNKFISNIVADAETKNTVDYMRTIIPPAVTDLMR